LNTARILVASARADFLERVRRYSFLFTLGLALYFGYLTATGRIHMSLGEAQGIYNSAWVGALLSLVGSTFLSLAGFYFVKNTIQRDRETLVGQILASTPLSKSQYVFSKVLSNFAVLSSMIAILALSAVAVQFLRGEDSHVQFWPLLSPFLILAIPAMAVVAAVAVIFETIPFLSRGFGNILYFFLWTAALSIPIASHSHFLDLSGLSLIKDSAQAAAHLSANSGFAFSLNAGEFQAPVSSFRWDGISWTPGILLTRFAVLGFALALTLLAALFFDRFDSSRSYRAAAGTLPPPPLPSASLAAETTHAPKLTSLPTTLSTHSRFLTILRAELRLLLKGQKWWWYTIALALLITSSAVPSPDGRGIALAFAWIWPVLLWSSLGVRETRDQTHQLLFSAPHPIARQLPAAWLAGFILALLTGCGFAFRLILEGNFRGCLAWLIGACFIPTSALALGVWSGTGKLFEILYTLLWYLGPMHAFPALDFMASAPVTSHTHYPLLYLTLTFVFGLAALAGRKRQLIS
jgi:hypothetical protein